MIFYLRLFVMPKMFYKSLVYVLVRLKLILSLIVFHTSLKIIFYNSTLNFF